MSVFGVERSQTGATNKYDHAISLVDTTKPQESYEGTPDGAPATASISRTESGTLLGRQITKGQGTLRKELARRKYAKYQESKDSKDGTPRDSIDEDNGTADLSSAKNAERTGRLRDRIPLRGKKKVRKAKQVEDSFIDVLYENQRGSFFCGIPLYSSNSLLNFDPSAWQTANFQDSAVNITNFQLPDPSWAWDWKTWYVDMSNDVDEEGWEYSFSFNKAYAWHGNHPWLFSFVRRRRWLRKRVKIYLHHLGEKTSKKMGQAHMLNEDYFTIHAAKRNRSRDSSGDRSTTNRSSHFLGQNHDSDGEQDTGDIPNVSALMSALKIARVDREKISAVNTFLAQGGYELFYLADAIPDIMEKFVYQTSKRQLQHDLLKALDESTRNHTKEGGNGKGKSKDSSDPDIEARKRKTDHMLKAIHAAGIHVNDADYWSDLRARATSTGTDPTNETHALDAAEPAEVSEAGPHSQGGNDEPSVKEEIKGIPDDAHISKEPGLNINLHDGANDENRPPAREDKGKGTA